MNIIIRVVIATFVLVVNVANAGLSDKLDGVWEGVGHQTSNGGTDWTIRFTAENGTFQIEYPSLSCSGTWTFLSETSGSVTFFEDIVIREDQCVDGGTVEVLKLENNQLKFIYYLPDGYIDAFGTLTCPDCNINTNTVVIIPM